MGGKEYNDETHMLIVRRETEDAPSQQLSPKGISSCSHPSPHTTIQTAVLFACHRCRPVTVKRGDFCPSEDIWQHLVMFVCHTGEGMLLASSWQRLWMALHLLQCAGQAPTKQHPARNAQCPAGETLASTRPLCPLVIRFRCEPWRRDVYCAQAHSSLLI